MNHKTDLQRENNLELKYGFQFTDLFNSQKLKELADTFYNYYEKESPAEYAEFAKYRDTKGAGFEETAVSNILISSARHLEKFLGDFFGISGELDGLKKEVDYERVLLNVKKDFFQKRVFKKFRSAGTIQASYDELNSKVSVIKKVLFSSLKWSEDEERSTAVMIDEFLELEKDYKTLIDAVKTEFNLPESSGNKANEFKNKLFSSPEAKFLFEKFPFSESDKDNFNYELIKKVLELFEHWCIRRAFDKKAKIEVKHWILYKIPLDLNYFDLVHNKEIDVEIPQRMFGKDESLRRRDGFKLTDERYNEREVMSEVEYCVFCHERKKDSCSKGLFEKDGKVKKNPLGIKLNGCPLDEKISEMHYLKNEGHTLGALAAVMVDNPMCPGTGHRICNDCMKACIYQKQEPVNIPQIETKVLTEVLNLTYGFEIYSLLTRWNPLNVKRPYALPYNGKNVLVVGLGPAGYTLSQYLLNEGFGVVGVDGLKIEHVHKDITGYKDEKGK